MFKGMGTTGPLELIVGSPGGSRIPTTVAQAIINIVDFGADAEKAIKQSKWKQPQKDYFKYRFLTITLKSLAKSPKNSEVTRLNLIQAL